MQPPRRNSLRAVLPNSPQTVARSQARVQLNEGVQAFTGALYPAAMAHFTSAVELDPVFELV